MVNFKSFLALDIENTFFNPNELASVVDIDGIPTSVVMDNDLIKAYEQKDGGEGLEKGELLFHVKVSDMPEKPFIDKTMQFNFKSYQIVDFKEVEGVYVITLGGAFSSHWS